MTYAYWNNVLTQHNRDLRMQIHSIIVFVVTITIIKDEKNKRNQL